jgi:hypothetical protein
MRIDMPEFVVVTFPTRRSVFMDNQPMGHTGDPLTIQAGFHDFDLGSPADYTPATQNVNVVNTTAPNPMIVSFAPVMAAPPRAKRKAKAAKKKAAKKTSKKKTAKKAKKIAPKKKAAKRTAASRKTAAAKKSAKKKAAKKK